MTPRRPTRAGGSPAPAARTRAVPARQAAPASGARSPRARGRPCRPAAPRTRCGWSASARKRTAAGDLTCRQAHQPVLQSCTRGQRRESCARASSYPASMGHGIDPGRRPDKTGDLVTGRDLVPSLTSTLRRAELSAGEENRCPRGCDTASASGNRQIEGCHLPAEEPASAAERGATRHSRTPGLLARSGHAADPGRQKGLLTHRRKAGANVYVPTIPLIRQARQCRRPAPRGDLFRRLHRGRGAALLNADRKGLSERTTSGSCRDDPARAEEDRG